MEDPEEKNTLIEHPEITSTSLKLCRKFTCRLKSSQLQLKELYQFFLLIISTEMIFVTIAFFMREQINTDIFLKGEIQWSFNNRFLPVAAIYIIFIQYLFSYLNLASNGWGDPKSRFWCDIRIMYIQGYNTIRTFVHFFSISVLFIYAACISGMSEISSLVFLCIINIIAVWQLGIAELTNQYDTKIQAKADEFVSLEILQYLQHQRTLLKDVNWVPTLIAVFLNITSWGFLFLYSASQFQSTQYEFLRTILIILVFYTFVLPIIFHVIYQKNLMTFCELEIHRMFIDVFAILIFGTFTMI